MTLILPTPSATLGPLWATQLNTALTLVDAHDHSTGKGVKVTPSGLNINTDLSFQSNSLTLVKTVAFDSQSATLASSNIRSVYSVSGDLYYNNGSGTPVQITSGTSVQSSASTIARAFERVAVNANKTILAADTYSFLDTDTGSAIVYTLPAANSVSAGRFYEFKDSTGGAASNNITINRAGADTIDGLTTLVINAAYGSTRLVSDGSTKWMIGTRPENQFLLGTTSAVQTQLNTKAASAATTIFTSSGTWTKATLNPKFVKVTVIGAGGGGGGTSATGASANACAGSGGGGGTSIKIILAGSLGATETVTVGTGGTASAGASGGTGGTSSFGTHASATGGTGGASSAASSGTLRNAGGDGGVGSSGTVNFNGGSGSNGNVIGGEVLTVGLSGSSFMCQSARLGNTAAGATPGGYGGGGTGATAGISTASRSGGAGADGVVIVEEFY